MQTMKNILRQIPKVDVVLKADAWLRLVATYPEGVAKEALRNVLTDLRDAIQEGKTNEVPPIASIIEETAIRAAAMVKPGLNRVINGTGVIIHTNLGRSLLAETAIEAIVSAARHYTNLEFNLSTGLRGDRYEHCAAILKKLTGREASIVVNNNAGAVFLVLNTFAQGKEVVISRGELVEIGGSFRIPDVMKRSGALLREVGTTNRTYTEDYEAALCEETALLMKVHTSNYRIRGFVHETTLTDFARLGHNHHVPTFYDAGSGLFFPLGDTGAIDEPMILDETVKAFDIVSFSGDKLLGAPQAGIIVGRKEYIDAIKENPMTRALRPDKFTLAGLERTLLLYLDPETARREIPTLRMIYEEKEVLRRRARRIAAALKKSAPGLAVTVVDVFSEVGGGSLPDVEIPSCAIAVKPDKMNMPTLEKRLAVQEIPIVGRIEKENLILDMRTILKDDETPLVSGLLRAIGKSGNE